ncbi:MAG: hypothetical protein Q8P31_11585 [Bacillota bacterium]|nr:hypothetical protein [Bacillota bacterium]
MTIWDRIRGVDRRLIYVVFGIILLIPQFKPLMIPMNIDRMVPPLYEAIEKLQPGDPVWISVEYSAVMASEMTPTLHAVVKHLYRKQARVFFMGSSTDGAMFAQDAAGLAPAGYEWGRNVVNFGFIAGYEAAVASLALDIPKTFPADFKGQAITGMPIMEGIKDIRDIKLVYQLTGGGLGPLLWVRQVALPYGIPVATCVSSSMLASAVPYYESGQLLALLNGLVGAAEYELLTKSPAKGLAGMAGQSLGHLFVIALVLVGNVAFIMQRRRQPKGN